MNTIKAMSILLLMFCVGCNGVDRFLRQDTKEEEELPPKLIKVACCRPLGVWPESVPQEHRDYCGEVRQKNGNEKVWEGGWIYIPMSAGCGVGMHDIGDEYYQ